MWKNYSLSYLKKNRASSISIMAAALIASLFLSLICSLFYNFWVYEIEKIVLEDGNWHGRIQGEISAGDLVTIQNFANVEKATVNEALSDANETVVDICFKNAAAIYREMPFIADKLGLKKEAVSYHEVLLSRYLIHDPQDRQPPLLMTFYLIILFIVSSALVLIIRNSFAVSMNARIHQFGIFSSVGATPGQVLTCLLQEAAALCALPIFLGSLLGLFLSFLTIQASNIFAADITGRHEAVFSCHPLVLFAIISVSAVTVLVSAWLPAKKLSRLTPLQAIQGFQQPALKRKKHSRILSLLFGVEGELASCALKAQEKALRTSTLSLTLSFLGFTVMLCFFTLSGISTNHTYFEKYQHAWDVRATVKNAKIEDFVPVFDFDELQDVQSCAVYQKALAVTNIQKTEISSEVNKLGGLENVAGNAVTLSDGTYQVEAPVIILDDAAFTEYCRQIGINPRLDGGILLNRIWDSVNSNFRYKEYVPYLQGNQDTVTLYSAERKEISVQIPILAYTADTPVLREEYDNYALVHILPLSVWENISEQIGNTENDTYIRLLGREKVTLDELNTLEKNLLSAAGNAYKTETENRIHEKQANNLMIKGFMIILGAFCVLLAVVGIANVFFCTMGLIRQRRQEFARYRSIGMTPKQLRKLFGIEVLIIAGRPLLITLPLTVVSVGFMITASYLNPMEFLVKAPFIPIAVFIAAIFAFVSLAYYLGGKKVLECSLAEMLRNDCAV